MNRHDAGTTCCAEIPPVADRDGVLHAIPCAAGCDVCGSVTNPRGPARRRRKPPGPGFPPGRNLPQLALAGNTTLDVHIVRVRGAGAVPKAPGRCRSGTVGRELVPAFGVAVRPGGHERAAWYHVQLALPGVVEGSPGAELQVAVCTGPALA